MCFFYQIFKRIIDYNHNIFKFDLSKLATQVNDFTDKVLCKQKALS